MKVVEFQRRLDETLTQQHDSADARLLTLARDVGVAADAYELFLRNVLSREAAILRIGRAASALLVGVSALATFHDLSLASVARTNLLKARALFRDRLSAQTFPRVPAEQGMTLDGYQGLASLTDLTGHLGQSPEALRLPLLGLSGEVGGLLDAHKKELRHDTSPPGGSDFLTSELGDVLWYTTAMASHAGLRLGDLAQDALKRALDALPPVDPRDVPQTLADLDRDFPETERLPRRMVIRFSETPSPHGLPVAQMTLMEASPNPFADGLLVRQVGGTNRTYGFSVGEALGDMLDDNSRRTDGYRYHDAIHLGFLAVLGWSPTQRALLRVKRKSHPQFDSGEDGARAIFAEEGIAAILAKRAQAGDGFLTEAAVDEVTIRMCQEVTEDLEIADAPEWLWRRAIAQGFRAMDDLHRNKGGYLTADIALRSLTFSRTAPRPKR